MSAVLVTPEALADKFAANVREQLTAAQLRDVIALNRTLGYWLCCATHNYCDANLLMLDAYVSLAGIDDEAVVIESDAVLELMNKAWDIARAENFGVTP